MTNLAMPELPVPVVDQISIRRSFQTLEIFLVVLATSSAWEVSGAGADPLAVPTSGAAQTAEIAVDGEVGQPPLVDVQRPGRGPDGRDRWHLELTGGFFMEAWDLNLYKEQLVGGAITLSRQMTPNWAVGVEANLLHVNQNPTGDVFLPTVSLMLRWSAFRVGQTSVFFESGGGASYASDEVPNRGTRFNLIFQSGAGIVRYLSPRLDLVGGLRWVHLSNNSLAGGDHNPDIQALGLYVGWRVN